ncbi:TPA: hypothetical protein NNW70_004186 [Salmonella enterica]|nr:hypothetical protein [Salmonella enterica]HCH9607896.1 hypothetical protein [Salmonella enterica]HDI5000190.1 hypothetical protein [Salmonella enterica]
MASTKIQNLPLKAPIGAMKIPTGGFGDYSITVSSIGDFIIDAFNLATKDYVDNLLVEKEDRIDLTGGYLTPTSQNANVPDTTNDTIDEVAQALLDRIEYVKDVFGNRPLHNELNGRSEINAHPSTSISHGSGTVSSKFSSLDSNLNNINNNLIPNINNNILLKEDKIVNGNNFTEEISFSPVPSTSSPFLNTSLQELANRDEFLNVQFNKGINPTFDQAFADKIGGYPLNARLMLSNGDIVKNTTPNNTTDPNVDMTGWVNDNSASQIKYENGIDAQTVKDRIVYIQDFGGSSTDFDPSVAEVEAKAVANPNSKPYDGARQFAFPMKTLKVWNYCDGYLDRGAVASIRNVDSFSSNEPRTEVLGVDSSAQLANYTDRDVVGLYVQSDGQPALLTSTNTTYTATTVTCPDIESKRNFIRKNQIIDVIDGNVKYSSRIQGVDGNTVTVDGWYIHGTSNTGTPPDGSQAKFVPNTKVWATNFNVILKPESDAESMVGIELGTFNNKYPNGAGYGYDIWSGGKYTIGAAFQARGQYKTGLYLYDRCDTGTIVSNPNVGHLIVGSGAPDTYGVLSHKLATSFLSRGATVYGYAQVTESGEFLTGTNSDGAWANLKHSYRVISSGQTIGDNTVAITNPTAPGQDIFLPNATTSACRTIHVKNISPTYDVYLGGAVEGGGGSVLIKPKECVQLFCDGYTWFILSHYKPTAA